MNVLLITVDQQIYKTMYEDFPVELKAIKRLRESGRVFNNGFTPIAQCVPARASLLTGLLPHAHETENNFCIDKGLSTSYWTYSSEFRKNGFLVGQVGKWHISKKQDVLEYGFDDNIPMINKWHIINKGKCEIIDPIIVREDVANGEVLSGIIDAPLEEMREYVLASEAIGLINKYNETNKPWHIRVEIEGPHVPWIVPKEYSNVVAKEDIKMPDNFYETFENKPSIQKRQHRSANLCSCYHDWDWTAQNLVRYYGYIKMIDDQVLRVLEHLDKLGLPEDTLIIYTADHGELAGAHNRIGKGEVPYDELYRIPMIASWKTKITPNSSSDEFLMLHDLGPTMLAAAGIVCEEDTLKNIHGKNMLHLFTDENNEAQIRREILMGHNGTFQPIMIRILRDKKGKYVFNPFDEDEYYDLENDPCELINQISNDKYKDIIKGYRKRLLNELKNVNEKWINISRWFLQD